MQYRFRIKAANLKRQPDENIKIIYTEKNINWQKMANTSRRWRKRANSLWISKNWTVKTLFYTRFNTPVLKQKAHHALIEDPNKTWDALQTLILNKDTSFVKSAEMSSFQQSSSISVTTDSRFTNFEKTLNDISIMLKNHQINATYDQKNSKMKQDFTRFCTYCKKSGRTVKFCWSFRRKQLNEEKALPQPKKTSSQNCANRSKVPNKYRSNSNDHSDDQRGRTTRQPIRCKPQS